MNQLRILFVDDDPNILRGLQRMLHRHRDKWNLEFADSGHAALQLLESRPVEIVISDMRMPEMDGAKLLDHIKSEHPETVRGILSGQADQDQTVSVIGRTHFYLSKPCSPRSLTSAIERIEQAFQAMPNPELRKRILTMESVPSTPQNLERLRVMLADANCDIMQVGQIVATDVGLSARILQLVCSSFLGQPRTDVKVADAVAGLGRGILAKLIDMPGFALPLANAEWFPLDQFLGERRLIAELAGKIAEAESAPADVQAASYNAGWLTGLGPLVLASIYPEQYKRVLTDLPNSNRSLVEAERASFGCHQANVSGFVAGVWGLPNAIVTAVSSLFSDSADSAPQGDFSATTAVQVASALVAMRLESKDEMTPFLDRDSLARLDATFLNRLADWQSLASDSIS